MIMNFMAVFISNFKRMLKNKKNIVPSFIIPLIVIMAIGSVIKATSGSDNETALINSDKGRYGQEFVAEIQKNTKIKVYTKEKGMEAVKKKRIPACYEIPENFSELLDNGEKPRIIAYKIEKGVETGNFQFNANSLVSKMLMRSEFKSFGKDVSLGDLSHGGTNVEVTGNDKKNVGDIVMLNMLMSFVLFGSIGISIELCSLERENVLKRSFATANKPQVIIGGILAAMFVMSSLAFCIIFFITSLSVSPGYLNQAPVVMVNIAAMVLLSLSLGVFVTRTVKNENMLNVVLQMVVALSCFVGGSFMPVEFLPKSISRFSKFMPQYWALKSINTNNAWLSLIVVLFALVLFTAGTFKVKNFSE